MPLGGEESSPSVESLINWLLEHDNTGFDELSDDSDIMMSYIYDSWSDQEMDDLQRDEVCDLCYISVCHLLKTALAWFVG